MNYRKKSLILFIFFVISLQVLIYTKNSQKSSFRYFIWNIQSISIGRLISISFISGIVVSSIFNKTLINNIKDNSKKTINEERIGTDENNSFINNENKNDSGEIPPERDMRDPQPTISVNYRVIKNNQEDNLTNREQSSNNSRYDDDWNNKANEW